MQIRISDVQVINTITMPPEIKTLKAGGIQIAQSLISNMAARHNECDSCWCKQFGAFDRFSKQRHAVLHNQHL